MSLGLIGRLGHVSELVYLLIPSITKYLLKTSYMLGKARYSKEDEQKKQGPSHLLEIIKIKLHENSVGSKVFQ